MENELLRKMIFAFRMHINSRNEKIIKYIAMPKEVRNRYAVDFLIEKELSEMDMLIEALEIIDLLAEKIYNN